VDQAKGAFSAQMLLQLETDMLLSLAVLQLTASMPDSHPGAQAAHALACGFDGGPLHKLWIAADIHRLPRPAAYSGSQVALQMLTFSCGQQQPTLQLPRQQQEHQQLALPKPQQEDGLAVLQLQQQQQQSPQQEEGQSGEWCVFAPTAALLAELLPLLTRHCQAHVQQHQAGQYLQAAAAAAQQQLVSTTLLKLNVHFMKTLLMCSMVPAPCTATATDLQLPPTCSWMRGVNAVAVQAAAAAAATAAGFAPTSSTSAASAAAAAAAAAAADVTEVATAAGHSTSRAMYSCVLHAQDVLMQHAGDIISMFEAALRCAAADCKAAAGAASTAAAGGGGSSTSSAIAAAAAAAAAAVRAHNGLGHYAGLLVEVCHTGAMRDHPRYPCSLALLALAAGPGSQAHHQLHSLLATMVKLSGGAQ
jgi:hypothetical protein